MNKIVLSVLIFLFAMNGFAQEGVKFMEGNFREALNVARQQKKMVFVDVYTSWCGPCRQEMKNLLPIYDELKGEDLVFISISLDKREKDWRRMLETENLPWIMLWNKEGFSVGDAPNTIQKAYGFYSIPFIVLIDREGRIMGRGLRGEQVKDAIVKARKM